MPVLPFIVLAFILLRRLRWHRHGWHGYRRYGRRGMAVHFAHGPLLPAAPHSRPVTPVVRESHFERLKRRYVNGEISDETYELELDALLRTPEGRREVG